MTRNADVEVDVDAALDRLSEAFCALDGDRRVAYLNARAAELLDGEREDVVGRPFRRVSPLDEATLREEFDRVAETGRPTEFRERCDPLDAWFDVRVHPADDGLFVYARDVTDRRRERRDLVQHATIVEAVHDGVVAFDADGRVTLVNQAVEGLFGTDRSDLVGRRVGDLGAASALDDESARAVEEAVEAVRTDVDSERLVEIRCAPGDAERVGEMRLVPLPIDSEGGAVGVIRDVTQREEHERVIAALHEVTRQLFGADTRDEICAVAVQAAANLLDLELSGVWLLDEERNRLEPVAATARTHDELGGLPHFADGEGLVWDAFRSGDPKLFEDLWNVDGVYNPDTPIRSELIVPIGEHGVLMAGEPVPDRFDETDLELAETLAANTEAALDRADREQLLRARKGDLERQSDRLETIAAVLSRDIKSELATTRANLPRDGEGVSAALDALATAERLVDDVRVVAGAAREASTRTRVSLLSAARDAAGRVEGVTVEPVDADADSTTLRVRRPQFVRFLTAFLRYADERSDEPVTVRVGRLDDRSGFYLEDDGPPIPPEKRADLFDPDARAADDPPGLGPALAREIAVANGWELSAPAPEEVDGGARFEIADVTTLD